MQLTVKQKSEGWRIVKFGEIAKSVSKRVDPSATELEVYVGLEHLDPDNLRITRRGVPSDVKGQKLLVKPSQIIFGKRRAYQRKVAVADFEGICSAHAMVLEAIPEAVVPEYLPFFMQSDMFMERAVAISEGSLSPTIKWKTLANQEFPMPPRPRQEEMLEVFEKIEDNLFLLDRLIYQSEKLFNTLRQKILSSFNGINSLYSLDQILKYEQPTKYIVKSIKYSDEYKTPVLTAGKSFIKGYTNEEDGIYLANKNPVIIFDDFTTDMKFVDFDFKVKSSAMKMLTLKDACKFNLKFVFNVMQNIIFDASKHKRYWISEYSQEKATIPEIEIQNKVNNIFNDIEIIKLTSLDKTKNLHKLRVLLLKKLLEGAA